MSRKRTLPVGRKASLTPPDPASNGSQPSWVTLPEYGLTFSCFGAQAGVYCNEPDVVDLLRPHLPPGWKPMAPTHPMLSYSLFVRTDTDGQRLCTVWMGQDLWLDGIPLVEALSHIRSALHVTVSVHAREVVFVHAGAVGWKGQALVLPGASHCGKTTLVKALVEAGATYYSDEFAVLDAEGRVHPYARALAVRDEEGYVTHRTVESLGGVAGTEPLPVRLVVAARYVPGSTWCPEPLSPGQGVQRLFENTVLAQSIPEKALVTFRSVFRHARGLAGVRGDASEVAASLLQEISLP